MLASESGLALNVDIALQDVAQTHTLLVSGGDGFREAMDDPELIKHLSRLARKAKRITSVCTGTFLLAQANLLANKRATTHWAHADALKARFPEVRVFADELYIRSGKIITGGGMASGIDMALDIIREDHGDELARKVSQRMVVFLNRSGGQLQFQERLTNPCAEDGRFEKLIARIARNPVGNLSNQVLAEKMCVSERHLARLFKQKMHTTPARWLERTRIDHARRYLETSTDSSNTIASNSGFASEETFRQSFQRVMKMSPAQYRRLHRST